MERFTESSKPDGVHVELDGLTCEELVELVTEYLEGGLSDAGRARFEEHVRGCGGCSAYLDQIQHTITLTGRLAVDDLTDESASELLAAFRTWSQA